MGSNKDKSAFRYASNVIKLEVFKTLATVLFLSRKKCKWAIQTSVRSVAVYLLISQLIPFEN